MREYLIYPIKGKAAREYLEHRLGCSVGTHIMSIPEHLKEVATSDTHVSAIMCNGEMVFRMQYYLTARYRAIVPPNYQMTFSDLMKAYSLNEALTEAITGSYGLVFQLLQGIPVQRSVAELALKRISGYTGHPYDLENVRVVLGDSVTPDYTMTRQ